MTTKLAKKIHSFKPVFGLVLIMLVFCSSALFGATKSTLNKALITVTGQVTSAADGLPLIGVNILVRGTSKRLTFMSFYFIFLKHSPNENERNIVDVEMQDRLFIYPLYTKKEFDMQ